MNELHREMVRAFWRESVPALETLIHACNDHLAPGRSRSGSLDNLDRASVALYRVLADWEIIGVGLHDLLRRQEGRALWALVRAARAWGRALARGQRRDEPCWAARAFELALALMRRTDYPCEGQR